MILRFLPLRFPVSAPFSFSPHSTSSILLCPHCHQLVEDLFLESPSVSTGWSSGPSISKLNSIIYSFWCIFLPYFRTLFQKWFPVVSTSSPNFSAQIFLTFKALHRLASAHLVKLTFIQPVTHCPPAVMTSSLPPSLSTSLWFPSFPYLFKPYPTSKALPKLPLISKLALYHNSLFSNIPFL